MDSSHLLGGDIFALHDGGSNDIIPVRLSRAILPIHGGRAGLVDQQFAATAGLRYRRQEILRSPHSPAGGYGSLPIDAAE
jgi:hypothetical protein